MDIVPKGPGSLQEKKRRNLFILLSQRETATPKREPPLRFYAMRMTKMTVSGLELAQAR